VARLRGQMFLIPWYRLDQKQILPAALCSPASEDNSGERIVINHCHAYSFYWSSVRILCIFFPILFLCKRLFPFFCTGN
jgi:hypothetical protein